MFEVLVREAAARFGLGDKALPLLQIVLYHMTRGGARGLAEFLEKFKEAGLGPTVQSWLGGGPVAKPISNEDLDKVLGSSDGLISTLTHKLELDRENVTSALGYLLPSLVGKLTPGGSLPSRIPPEVQALADEGKRRVEAPAVRAPVAASSGGAMKWLPWVIVALAVVLGLGYCSTRGDKGDNAVAPAVEESSAPATPDSSDTTTPPATSTEPGDDAPAPDAAPDNDAPAAAQPSAADDATTQPDAMDEAGDGNGDVGAESDGADVNSGAEATGDADDQGAAADEPDQGQGAATDAEEPAAAQDDGGDQSAEDESTQDMDTASDENGEDAEQGEDADENATSSDDAAESLAPASSAVEASTVDGKPALKVFFESGDATVPAEFSDQTADLLDYLKEHDAAKVQVSGFTDATGSAQFNEELAEKRANAVLAALVMDGVEESQVSLAKPQKVSSDDEGDQPTSRRVEVTVVDAEE